MTIADTRARALHTRAVGDKISFHCPPVAHWRLIGGAAIVSQIGHRRTYNINLVPGSPEASVRDVTLRLVEIGFKVRNCEPNRTFPVYTFEVDGVPVTFGRPNCLSFGRHTDPFVIAEAQLTHYGHLPIVDFATVFDLKLIVAMQRHRAVDLFDLWYMIHRMRDKLPVDLLAARLAVLRPEITFHAMRDRLCGQPYSDWDAVVTAKPFKPADIVNEMLDSMAELEMRTTGLLAY